MITTLSLPEIPPATVLQRLIGVADFFPVASAGGNDKATGLLFPPNYASLGLLATHKFKQLRTFIFLADGEGVHQLVPVFQSEAIPQMGESAAGRGLHGRLWPSFSSCFIWLTVKKCKEEKKENSRGGSGDCSLSAAGIAVLLICENVKARTKTRRALFLMIFIAIKYLINHGRSRCNLQTP